LKGYLELGTRVKTGAVRAAARKPFGTMEETMCGLAGYASIDRRTAPTQQRTAVLQAMGRQLSRRGPDDEQLLIDDHLDLVFRRLSILDCAGGRQPIANEDGTVFAAVNGEIFNHQELRRALVGRHDFRTKSDSEIVVHLYEEQGLDFLRNLAGMYAIAIWDSPRRQLLLARDRFGIKPLYYSHCGADLLFASEVKALLAHPASSRELEWRDWDAEPGRIPTYVKGVDALPAAHYLVWNARGERVMRRYWSLESAFLADDTNLTAQDYIDRFADLFEDSIAKVLMSDVPVGAFLSGGLDSAAMVAVAAKHNHLLPCFTILEKTTVDCGDAQAAADLASYLHAPFYSVLFDQASLEDHLQLGLEDLEYFIWLMDCPLFTLEFLFKHELHRFAKTAIPDLKVMLIGQGADEFAGGYSNGVNKPHANWDDYVTKSVLPLWKARRRHELGVSPHLSPALSDGVLGPLPREPFKAEMNWRLQTLQMFNLWHEDRTSSGQGVEARVPYLDHRLVELLASIPGRLHAELFWDKRIIRSAARRWLPERFVTRRKLPFVYGSNRASTVELQYQWVSAIFPSFRDKYLQGPHRLFNGSVLFQILRSAAQGGETRETAVRLLLECMSISIFNDICRKGPGDFLASWRPPSPLRSCDPALTPWRNEAQLGIGTAVDPSAT
jgi:asparagine synthase (glutamine-hydrolysing)